MECYKRNFDWWEDFIDFNEGEMVLFIWNLILSFYILNFYR